MIDRNHSSWQRQWHSQYDAMDNSYGIVPLLIGLAVVAGGGGYMAYESARVADEVHTDPVEMMAALNGERAKLGTPLSDWRDEPVPTMFLNAPANNTEAAIMSAFWYYRAARMAAATTGFTERAPVLTELGDNVRALVLNDQGQVLIDNGTGSIEQFFFNAAHHVGDISIGMRVAVQDLANPRAIEQRRYLSQTLGNPDYMRWEWARQSGRDIAEFAQNPLGFLDELKQMWEDYKWWIIGGTVVVMALPAIAKAKKEQKQEARMRRIESAVAGGRR